MVRMTYVGLGDAAAAVREFDLLTYVRALTAMQRECGPLNADWAALGIALDAVENAAYHFTQRRHFYHAVRGRTDERGEGNGRLGDPGGALATFRALAAYQGALGALQRRRRPFGRDYLALVIAKQGLDTAAYHFTREDAFYGAKGDGAGATRPGF